MLIGQKYCKKIRRQNNFTPNIRLFLFKCYYLHQLETGILITDSGFTITSPGANCEFLPSGPFYNKTFPVTQD